MAACSIVAETWNYLRVRGEYDALSSLLSCLRELPPRARRILEEQAAVAAGEGTTSACAENTRGTASSRSPGRNYLRVRGEYFIAHNTVEQSRELPPRARRIPIYGDPYSSGIGTTSACAENTCRKTGAKSALRNYLRVRGEYKPT